MFWFIVTNTLSTLVSSLNAITENPYYYAFINQDSGVQNNGTTSLQLGSNAGTSSIFGLMYYTCANFAACSGIGVYIGGMTGSRTVLMLQCIELMVYNIRQFWINVGERK